uniref:Uncharacterized protein n=1 Tax=Anguilla anguilla TaxID=7936 RepID=A0A0E9XNU8_ANGAN
MCANKMVSRFNDGGVKTNEPGVLKLQEATNRPSNLSYHTSDQKPFWCRLSAR